MEPWQEGSNVGGYVLQGKLWSSAGGVQAWRAVDSSGREAEVHICGNLDAVAVQHHHKALINRQRLQHPALLQMLALEVIKNSLVVIYEATEGSLRDLLTQCLKDGEPGIPPRELLNYVQPAAAALDYLHEQGFLHRDVSPDAILIKGLEGRLGELNMTTTVPDRLHEPIGISVGTPRYMAPERFQDKAEPASDQYSLAVTWAEMRLQRPLFPQQTVLQMMLDHLQTPPNLDALPEGERQPLLRALDKKPERRYPSCCAFVQELSEGIC